MSPLPSDMVLGLTGPALRPLSPVRKIISLTRLSQLQDPQVFSESSPSLRVYTQQGSQGKLLTESKAGQRQATLPPALLKKRDHLSTPTVNWSDGSVRTRSVWTQACLWKRGWEHSQRAIPQPSCSLSKMFSINYIVCPFGRTVSSPQTRPPRSRPSTCAFQPLGAFIFWFLPSQLQHQSALPPPPPPQRLCAASPFVIGISLMKKGWCLSHYSCGEGEDLGTNLLALTREDTCLHQEFNFPSACGNKRARFV